MLVANEKPLSLTVLIVEFIKVLIIVVLSTAILYVKPEK